MDLKLFYHISLYICLTAGCLRRSEIDFEPIIRTTNSYRVSHKFDRPIVTLPITRTPSSKSTLSTTTPRTPTSIPDIPTTNSDSTPDETSTIHPSKQYTGSHNSVTTSAEGSTQYQSTQYIDDIDETTEGVSQSTLYTSSDSSDVTTKEESTISQSTLYTDIDDSHATTLGESTIDPSTQYTSNGDRIELTTDLVPTSPEPTRKLPTIIGGNVELGPNHRHGYYRPGQASDTHSCDNVRQVPEELREAQNMYQYGIHESYQKYTEAYGIPIYGSSNVTDESLKRACYVIRLMLASRYDVRNSIYKLYVRIALIGDGEQQTDLWDYRLLDSDYWDGRARGVGATLNLPVCSAGDDNMRCKPKSRYDKEDILVHEFAHGVHQLGANYVIPRFQERLTIVYNNAIALGKYANTYMGSNVNEYFAQGAQMYFDSFNKGNYKYRVDGTVIELKSAESLRLYDPDLVDLMDEVFSCGNQLINRCAFKDKCDGSFYEEVKHADEGYTSGCRVFATYYFRYTPEECAVEACKLNAVAFRQSGIYCQLLDCASPEEEDLLLIPATNSEGLHIWKRIKSIEMDLEAESSQNIEQLCTVPPDVPGRCDVPSENLVQCGPEEQTHSQCEARGCCFINDQCVYSALAGCVDRHNKCKRYAITGDCLRNPGLMHRLCPLSCDLCLQPSPFTQEELEFMCQDTMIDCSTRMTGNRCDAVANQNKCPITCNVCSI